jgi:predicted CXXCH cytochrome family protein
MAQSTKRNIGKILLDGGFLLGQDLDRALEEQKLTKELLGQVLVRQGVLKADDIKGSLFIQEHLGTIENAAKLVAGDRQLLGALLVQSGYITNKQLDHVIAEQQRTGEKFGEVCKRLGMLTERQLNGLLDFQRNQEGAHDSPLRLGELLVATGHITREQLEDALHKQTQSKKNLGSVLIEEGYARASSIEYGARLQKMLLKSVLGAILALGMSTGSDAGEMCAFSKQLQSSPAREQYIAKVATETGNMLAYNTRSDDLAQSDASDDESSSFFSFGSKKSTLNQGEIDSFSKDCLSCHDGLYASDTRLNYKNSPGHKSKTFDGTKEHPIGMDYASYVAMDSNSYKPAPAFNSKMMFVNGKVGCTTCHNPLNPEEKHLVMSDFRSALCLTCHNK